MAPSSARFKILLTVPDWSTVLQGATRSAFIDGAAGGVRWPPGGNTLDLDEVLNMADCGKACPCSAADMDAVTEDRPWGVNNPRWQLYAYGAVESLLPTGSIHSPFYVVVMVGDDGADADGDPTKDANGIVLMRADAFGPGNARRGLVSAVARTGPTGSERGYAGQRGQGEQGRGTRVAPVQTPGQSLGAGEFGIASGGRMVK